MVETFWTNQLKLNTSGIGVIKSPMSPLTDILVTPIAKTQIKRKKKFIFAFLGNKCEKK